jgi:hypothetical protein
LTGDAFDLSIIDRLVGALKLRGRSRRAGNTFLQQIGYGAV